MVQVTIPAQPQHLNYSILTQMTKDYLQNNCALNFNMATAATGGYNFQGFRKGMYVELLLMFLIYFASQIYQAIKLSQIEQPQGKPGEQPPKVQLPWHQKRWNRIFPIHFANHAIALGFVILFYPLPAGLSFAYIHLVFFCVHIVMELKMKDSIAQGMLGAMWLCNIVLMILGLIGAGLTKYDGSSCKYIRAN